MALVQKKRARPGPLDDRDGSMNFCEAAVDLVFRPALLQGCVVLALAQWFYRVPLRRLPSSRQG